MKRFNSTKGTPTDRQITGLAGEYFVAAELLKRRMLVAVTAGNAKSIDLFVQNPRTGRTFTIDVKTLRRKNVFDISPKKTDPRRIYVFTLLGEADEAVTYWIVRGRVLAKQPQLFGKDFRHPTRPGIAIAKLATYHAAWDVFGKSG
jgi:hypothetical protein